MQIIFVFLGIVATAAGSYGAARYSGRSSVKVKEIEVDAAAYERADKINDGVLTRLDNRVKELEQKDKDRDEQLSNMRGVVQKLDRVFRIAINFIEQLLLWERDGSRPPRPHIPEDLKEYLDPSLIVEHARQQEELDNA